MEPRKSSRQCGLKSASAKSRHAQDRSASRKRSLMRGAGWDSFGIAPGCCLRCKRRLFENSQGRARSIVGTEQPAANQLGVMGGVWPAQIVVRVPIPEALNPSVDLIGKILNKVGLASWCEWVQGARRLRYSSRGSRIVKLDNLNRPPHGRD